MNINNPLTLFFIIFVVLLTAKLTIVHLSHPRPITHSSRSGCTMEAVTNGTFSNATAYWDYLNQNDLCTVKTCPMDYAFLDYLPTVSGNAFYAAWFAILLVGQLILGCYYRTWAYTFSMCSGLLLEIVGYVGRVMLHDDPFSNGNFLMLFISESTARQQLISPTQVHHLPHDLTRLLQRSNLSLPGPHCRHLWRASVTCVASNLHYPLHHRRFHCSASAG